MRQQNTGKIIQKSDEMLLKKTNFENAPWFIVNANNKDVLHCTYFASLKPMEYHHVKQALVRKIMDWLIKASRSANKKLLIGEIDFKTFNI
jgi:hypothetical protein